MNKLKRRRIREKFRILKTIKMTKKMVTIRKKVEKKIKLRVS